MMKIDSRKDVGDHERRFEDRWGFSSNAGEKLTLTRRKEKQNWRAKLTVALGAYIFIERRSDSQS